MTPTIPDLWSDDIRVDVLTPLAILRAQETFLRPRTKGILQATVSTAMAEDLVQHQFDLTAAVLGYSERVLTATHHRLRPYPVKVVAPCFASPSKNIVEFLVQGPVRPGSDMREAATQEEFVGLVREVLRSADVRSLIQSLIARSNEAPFSPPLPASNGNEGPDSPPS